MQAKSGLDKSPIVCGVTISVDFISEHKASAFMTQPQQKVDGAAQPTLQDQWLSQTEPGPPGSTSSSGLANGSHWDSMGLVGQFSQTTAPTTATTSSHISSCGGEAGPTNTLWSNSGFLSGLASPWSSTPRTESALFPSSSGSKQEPATMSSSPSLSTYLPNGLF